MTARYSSPANRNREWPFGARRRRRRGSWLKRTIRRIVVGAILASVAVYGGKFLPIDLVTSPDADISAALVTGPQNVRVVDGDTIWLLSENPVEKIRIIGLDAPETFRADCDDERRRGLDAKARLVELLDQADWSVLRTGRTDRYGRTLARIVAGGQDVASQLISEGYARPYNGGSRKGWC